MSVPASPGGTLQYSLLRCLLVAGLVAGLVGAPAALLLGGCQNAGVPADGPAAEGAGGETGEDAAVQEPDSRRPSPMLEQLRTANRQAELEYKREELAQLKAALADLEQQLTRARSRGEDTVTLEERQKNLRQVIASQERLLEQAGR